MKDKTFTFRINNDLLDSLSRHCERHEISKSVFIVRAIKKALESEGIESAKSPAPTVIDSSININNSLNIDELKKALEGDLKPLIESIAIEKLESQIDEIKEAQNAINDKIYQRLENLESQSSQNFETLDNDNDSPAAALSAINILKKLDNLTDIANNLKEGELIFSDKELRELNDLELDLIYQKFKEVGHFSIGWSSDSNNKRMTLLKCKMNKGIFGQKEKLESQSTQNFEPLNNVNETAPLPYEQAIERIKELSEKGYNFTEIANDLKGKYYTARKSINWERTQVERIINPEKGKTKKSLTVANKQHD